MDDFGYGCVNGEILGLLCMMRNSFGGKRDLCRSGKSERERLAHGRYGGVEQQSSHAVSGRLGQHPDFDGDVDSKGGLSNDYRHGQWRWIDGDKAGDATDCAGASGADGALGVVAVDDAHGRGFGERYHDESGWADRTHDIAPERSSERGHFVAQQREPDRCRGDGHNHIEREFEGRCGDNSGLDRRERQQ